MFFFRQINNTTVLLFLLYSNGLDLCYGIVSTKTYCILFHFCLLYITELTALVEEVKKSFRSVCDKQEDINYYQIILISIMALDCFWLIAYVFAIINHFQSRLS